MKRNGILDTYIVTLRNVHNGKPAVLTFDEVMSTYAAVEDVRAGSGRDIGTHINIMVDSVLHNSIVSRVGISDVTLEEASLMQMYAMESGYEVSVRKDIGGTV